jgi:NADH:ubiquinone oxidoreductase subunit K
VLYLDAFVYPALKILNYFMLLTYIYIFENNYNTFLYAKISSLSTIGSFQIVLGLSLLQAGFIGFTLNRENLIITLIYIELMLLGLCYFFISIAFLGNDPKGPIFALLFLALAGAEGSIGLSILFISNRIFGNIHINSFSNLRG